MRVGAGRQRLGKNAHVAGIALAAVADRSADDVVVQVALHVRAGPPQRRRVVRRAEQPLLLGIVGGEDNGGMRVRAGHHACRFQHRGGARCVIVGPRRIARAVRIVGVAGVVMAGHHIGAPARLVAAQGCDHAGYLNVTRDPLAVAGLDVFVECHRHPAIGVRCDGAELVCDPVARREYAAAGGGGFGERIARAERDQALVGRPQATGGDVGKNIRYCRVRRGGRVRGTANDKGSGPPHAPGWACPGHPRRCRGTCAPARASPDAKIFHVQRNTRVHHRVDGRDKPGRGDFFR